LNFMQPVSGVLDTTTPEATFTFEIPDGFVFSLFAWTRTGNLTFELALLDDTGQPLAQGTPPVEGAPSRMINAVTAPAGRYAVTLRRTGDTAGEFRLQLLPGYGFLDKWDDFESFDQQLSLNWDPLFDLYMTASIMNGTLYMQVMKEGTLGRLPPADDLDWTDLYMEADVLIDGTPSHFQYGFLLRTDPACEEFYAVLFSSDGDWALLYYDALNDWQVIQDWTVSPLIDPTDMHPHVAVFVQGSSFKVYFNQQFVGEVTDLNNLSVSGNIGLAASTASDQTDPLAVHFDNLVITSPSR
jgi:hypothetical protein